MERKRKQVGAFVELLRHHFVEFGVFAYGYSVPKYGIFTYNIYLSNVLLSSIIELRKENDIYAENVFNN